MVLWGLLVALLATRYCGATNGMLHESEHFFHKFWLFESNSPVRKLSPCLMHVMAYFPDQRPDDTGSNDFCARMCKGKEKCPTGSGCQKRCQESLELLDKLESSICPSTTAINNTRSGE